MSNIIIQDWGLIPYEESLKKQEALLASRIRGEVGDHLILCSHPPVVTLGLRDLKEDVSTWSGSVVSTRRGGRATYHGPGQLVLYPILDLSLKREACRSKDIRSYLQALERFICEVLFFYGVKTKFSWELEAQEGVLKEEKRVPYNGVWTHQRKKLASIGVGVSQWCSYHGVALNVMKDGSYTDRISPCGFSSEVMTSVEEVLGEAELDVLKEKIKHSFSDFFKLSL